MVAWRVFWTLTRVIPVWGLWRKRVPDVLWLLDGWRTSAGKVSWAIGERDYMGPIIWDLSDIG